MSPSPRIQTGNLLGFLWIKLVDGTTLKALRAKAKTAPTGRLKSSVLELSSTLRFEQLFHNVASRIEPKQIGSQLARWQNIIKKQLVGLQSITYSPSTTQPHTPLPDADLLETGVLPLRQPTTVVAGVSNTNSAH
uniref:(northern house mosquito) hypothetical protein n=1 Tax=Culex pipiens TaxID=7175 RepID=A0A8D8JV44_CULPI